MKREKYAYIEGIISVFGNAVIFAIKLYIGILINSLSLISDAYHTLTDIVGSLIIIIGFYFASRPPDIMHPLGHGRIEHLTTILGSIVLFITGGFILYEGILRLLMPEEIIFNLFFIIIVAVTAVIKEGMARIAFYYGKKIDGDALRVDAWHHRSDALLSLGVIAVIFLNSYFIYTDGIFSIFISFLIIYEALTFFRKGVSKILGEKLPDEMNKKINELAANLGIKVHDIMMHDYGKNKIINLHIDVSSEISAGEAHLIATKLENEIKRSLGMECMVHVDTYDNEMSKKVEIYFKNIIENYPEIKGYRNFEIYTSIKGLHADVEILFDPKVTLEKMQEISDSLEKLLFKKYGVRLITHFETFYQNINLSEKNTEYVGDK
ncbi:MAG: cation diffusion facilitator family transporter [Thermoplasmata archaeon]